MCAEPQHPSSVPYGPHCVHVAAEKIVAKVRMMLTTMPKVPTTMASPSTTERSSSAARGSGEGIGLRAHWGGGPDSSNAKQEEDPHRVAGRQLL